MGVSSQFDVTATSRELWPNDAYEGGSRVTTEVYAKLAFTPEVARPIPATLRRRGVQTIRFSTHVHHTRSASVSTRRKWYTFTANRISRREVGVSSSELQKEPDSPARLAHRYVAMIDILGFKALLASVPVMEIVARIDHLLSYVRGMQTYWASSVVTGETSEGSDRFGGRFHLNEMHFSDTIVVWTPPSPQSRHDPFTQLQGGLLVSSVARLICRAFLVGIPLRAGISFGECYIDRDRNILVGQAIAQAHEVEAAQEWIGGAIHNEARLTGLPGLGSVMDWHVPVKAGHAVRTRLALKWVDCTEDPAEDQLLKATLEAMMQAVSTPDVKTKLQNTKEFVDTIQGKLKYRLITESGGSDWFNPLNPDEHTRAREQANRHRPRKQNG
jgi:hypothetical protein